MYKDFQFVKYTPPELDEDGNVKKVPLNVEFKDTTPLELTQELKLRRDLLEVEEWKKELLLLKTALLEAS